MSVPHTPADWPLGCVPVIEPTISFPNWCWKAIMFAVWCVVVGGVLVFMALAGSVLNRLPFSAAMIYLAVGYAVGPADARGFLG